MLREANSPGFLSLNKIISGGNSKKLKSTSDLLLAITGT